MWWGDIHKTSAAGTPNGREGELHLRPGFTVDNRVTSQVADLAKPWFPFLGCHENTIAGGAVVQWVECSPSL